MKTTEFLATTENRSRALVALVKEPLHRRDLQEKLDVSQPTVSQFFGSPTERNWVTRNGACYKTTPLGELVSNVFTDLLEQLTLEAELRGVVAWFPEGGIGFDLKWLRDADVVTAGPHEPTAIWTHETGYLAAVDHVQILTDRTPPQSVAGGDRRGPAVRPRPHLRCTRVHPKRPRPRSLAS